MPVSILKICQQLTEEKDSKEKIQLFKYYATQVIAKDFLGELNNYPWGTEYQDGFPHQGGANALVSILSATHDLPQHSQDTELKQLIDSLIEIKSIVGSLELPPQHDDEQRYSIDLRLPQREKDWQRVIDLVNNL